MVCASNDALCLSSELFLSMTIVIIGARVGGLVFRFFKQPTVLGEIVAGIVLGPSVLGQFPGNIPNILFPADVRIFLNICAQLGLIIFMFVVGLEVDIPGLTQSSTAALLIGGMSVLVPFLIGTFVLSPSLYSKYKVNTCIPNPGNQTGLSPSCEPATSEIAFDLFLGVALSVTAFPVLARIITDYKMIRLPVGVLVMACAALNDLVAWVLMAICLAVKQASGGYLNVVKMVLALVGFFIALTHVLNPILRLMVVRQYRECGSVGPGTMAFVLINLLVASWFLHYLGFHAMLGAFMFGLAFPRSHDSGIFHLLLEKLETVSVLMLLPCFFLVTGLSIDISKLGAKGGMDLLYICIVAVFGKTLGAGITALTLKMKPRKCLTIAVLMNTRGLAEIVILNIGLQQNIINQDLFTIMVVMAVVTTIMAGPLLHVVYPSRLLEKDLLELDENLLKRGDIESEDAEILLAVVHDVSQAYNVVTAGLDSLKANVVDAAEDLSASKAVAGKGNRKVGPSELSSSRRQSSSTRPVQLVLLHFFERHGEMGTGLQETVAEVEQRSALDKCMDMLENENKILSGGLVMLRQKEGEGRNARTDIRNIAKTLLPKLLVVDWPKDHADQDALKHTMLTATCPILLYSGKSSEAFAPDPKPEVARKPSMWRSDPDPAAAAAAGGGGSEPRVIPLWLRMLFGPLLDRAAALQSAIEDEFGGVSLGCLLGRKPPQHHDDVEAAAAAAPSPDCGKPPGAGHARSRMDHLRNNADSLLSTGGPAAPEDRGAPTAPSPPTNLVTIMIAGLDPSRVSSTLDRPATATAVQVDDIFRTLGVSKPAWGTPKLEPTTAANGRRRMFAPILISPPALGADGVHGTPVVTPLSSPVLGHHGFRRYDGGEVHVVVPPLASPKAAHAPDDAGADGDVTMVVPMAESEDGMRGLHSQIGPV